MDLIERTIQVTWPQRVLFTDHVFDPANPLLRGVLAGDGLAPRRKTLVVVDQTLAAADPGLADAIATYFTAHADAVALVCPPLVVEGGEPGKNSWQAVTQIHAAIDAHHIDRQSYVLAVGGGALLDVAGFAAATAHRGVRHVRVPTTTLSQCDSGVGVKNGINAFGKKNFVGTFAPPWAVLNDFQLLATLAPRDKRGGYAEAVKVACIRDAAFFQTLEQDAAALREFEPAALRRLIRHCAERHLDHIADGGDPFENGSARPLDFGHWSAHKLEVLSGFSLRHGEAVALGIALDVIYARRSGLLAGAAAERVLALLEALGFTLWSDWFSGRPAAATDQDLGAARPPLPILQGLEEFREHLGGQLTVTLLKRIGEGVEVHTMEPGLIGASVAELAARQGRTPLPPA
jgi:3-dehydroquinate synthase